MRCDEIGVNVSKEQFCEYLNGVRGGQYFSVKGYVNAEGEKADHILRFGIKYAQIKERDVRFLRDVLAGSKAFTVQVKHGVWVSPAMLSLTALTASLTPDNVHVKAEYVREELGIKMPVTLEGSMNLMDVFTFSNHKGKKDEAKVQVTLSYELPSTHPLVIAAIGEADLQGTLLQGLINPKQATSEYDKEATSAYSMEKDGMTKWYIRDVLRVWKKVRVPGSYEFKASLPINAVKNAIESQLLLKGKYRQFILSDGQFETIVIEGQAILCDGIEEEFYFALPEHVTERAEAV